MAKSRTLEIEFSKKTNLEIAKIVVNSVKLFIILEVAFTIWIMWVTNDWDIIGAITFALVWSWVVAIFSVFVITIYALVKDSFILVNKK